MTDWDFKIHAYLHDPPDKPLALGRAGGHERWGRELAGMLAATTPSDADWALIKRADRLASGADRSPLLPAMRPALDDLRHPLSGQRVDLTQFGRLGPEAADAAREALSEEVGALAGIAGSESRFLGLWALLLPRLARREGPHELGALWDWLPAETRMPNHPVVVHQSLTSALASVLREDDEPALLSWSVGPVQGFIAEARRTSDLWAGSQLLSRVCLAAACRVAETLGPDHVVFPALRRAGLFGQWLLGESPWSAALKPLVPAGLDDEAGHGGLPNRFVAVVPEKRAEEVAEACRDAARDWWLRQAAAAAREIEEKAPALGGFGEMAREQADSLLQFVWAVSPWPAVDRCEPGSSELARVSWARGRQLPPELGHFIDLARRPPEPGRDRPFHPNGGALYGVAYDSAQVLLDAVKRTRPLSRREEGGLKCSLCGVRSVFAGRERFEDQKAAWSAARRAVRGGDLRRGEALCGVCWTKRRFGRREGGFQAPSTAEIAASPFKRAVLQRIREFGTEVGELCEAVEKARWPRAWVAPGLARYAREGGLAERFVRVDGELLLGTPREGAGPDDAGVPHDIGRAVARLRAAARALGILPPRPYLSVLAMDGDEMGKWLSGAKNPQLRNYLSEAAAQDLEGQGGREQLACQWPATPAFHATLSEACATFSQSTAPRTVERDGLLGTLVYAGGDDVLALFPVGCPAGEEWEFATEAARRLRWRYSGRVRRQARGDEPAPESKAGFVVDDGLRLAFGHDMTASAAIVVFHQRTPLQRALGEARRALEHAKDDLGRNALAISILRRSGQTTRTGLAFEGIPALQLVARAFTAGLSPRFLSEVNRRLAPLAGGLEGDELFDLAKPIVMQAVDDHFEGDPQAKAEATAAVAALAAMAAKGRDAAAMPPAAPRRGEHPPDRLWLDRWLGLIECAAFLAREVEP